jgi:glycosyltransferase involved in cell wall biosynthesis
MMISVIIPTFNRSGYLIEALQSVLGQKHVDLELIVVDDGSSDDTAKRLQPFLSTVRVHHQPNSGVSAARNAGIGMARGEWIAFLDSRPARRHGAGREPFRTGCEPRRRGGQLSRG